MRARLVLVVSGLSLIGAAFAIQACGETELSAPIPAEAGAGVLDGGENEAAPGNDASPCDTSANFTDKIPDAAIADGASTTGLCVQCANAKCAEPVGDCNESCECQAIAGDALNCYLKNSRNPIVCAAQFSSVDSKTQQIGLALLQCINKNCKAQCATESFQPTDAGDGG